MAGSDDRLPRKLPMGVRAELTMKTSFGRFTFPKLRARGGGCLHLLREGRRDLRVAALLKLAIFPPWHESSIRTFLVKHMGY